MILQLCMSCIVYKKCIKANCISTEIVSSYDVMKKLYKKKDRERKSHNLGLGMEDNSMKLMYSVGWKISE